MDGNNNKCIKCKWFSVRNDYMLDLGASEEVWRCLSCMHNPESSDKDNFEPEEPEKEVEHALSDGFVWLDSSEGTPPIDRGVCNYCRRGSLVGTSDHYCKDIGKPSPKGAQSGCLDCMNYPYHDIEPEEKKVANAEEMSDE